MTVKIKWDEAKSASIPDESALGLATGDKVSFEGVGGRVVVVFLNGSPFLEQDGTDVILEKEERTVLREGRFSFVCHMFRPNGRHTESGGSETHPPSHSAAGTHP
jgi:hypothetical protein